MTANGQYILRKVPKTKFRNRGHHHRNGGGSNLGNDNRRYLYNTIDRQPVTDGEGLVMQQ
jgi:hypothetical protein